MSAAAHSTSPGRLLTAEEFAELPDPGYLEELVEGVVVSMTMPKPRHGHVCNKANRLFGNFVEDHRLGWVFSNHTGVNTRREPDTVRGADVAFYSYARLPEGELPDHYPAVAPDLVIEVVSPSDRWPKVLAKVAEYLEAGVTVVVIFDGPPPSAQVFRPDGLTRVLGPDDALTLPEILPGFSVVVRRFFE